MKWGIESIRIQPNDDGTFTIQAEPTRIPVNEKKTDGPCMACWSESKTMTAETADDVVSKVQELLKIPAPSKGSKKHPLDQYLSNDTGDQGDANEEMD